MVWIKAFLFWLQCRLEAKTSKKIKVTKNIEQNKKDNKHPLIWGVSYSICYNTEMNHLLKYKTFLKHNPFLKINQALTR